MKTPNQTITLLALAFVGLFVSGCNSLPSAWGTQPLNTSVGLKNKAAIVVPVKGAPISLQDSTYWSTVLGGLAGVALQESVAQPKRETLVNQLAGESPAFCPEAVIAGECVVLLKRAGWGSGTNVTLYPGLAVMPGNGPVVTGETRVFKSTLLQDSDLWKNAYSQWITGPPVHAFTTPAAVSGQLVCLELTGTSMVKDGRLYSSTFLRLLDPVSGKPLASGCADTELPIHPLNQVEDLKAFVADYQSCARQIAETLLQQLNLIP